MKYLCQCFNQLIYLGVSKRSKKGTGKKREKVGRGIRGTYLGMTTLNNFVAITCSTLSVSTLHTVMSTGTADCEFFRVASVSYAGHDGSFINAPEERWALGGILPLLFKVSGLY